MKQLVMIKCNVGYMNYLYWSGVTWTREIARAMQFDSEKTGRKELATLSPPRVYDPKGPGPEVFSM